MIRKRVKDYVAGAQSYLDWHRTLDPGFHMTDIDSVEVTPSGVPLVFIELKKIRHRQPSLSYYLNLISEVYVRQAPIGKLFLYLSKVLPSCKFLIVVEHCGYEDWLYVYDVLRPERGWMKVSKQNYVRAMERLRAGQVS